MILKKTFSVYKNGFRQFFYLSIFANLTTFASTLVTILMAEHLIIGLILMIGCIFLLYFTFRANAGVILLTRDLIQNNPKTIRDAYRQTEGYASIYFGISLMVGLIMVVPLLGAIYSYHFIHSTFLKWTLVGIFGVIVLFLSTRYNLSIPSAILAGESGGLESGKRLVRGDFWQVLLVLIITEGGVIFLSNGLSYFLDGYNGIAMLIISTMIQALFLLLTAPIVGISSTILYLELNHRKQIDMIHQDHLPNLEPKNNCEIIQSTQNPVS